MPCSVVVGYKHFGGFCCLHYQGEVTGDEKKWQTYRPGVQRGRRGAVKQCYY